MESYYAHIVDGVVISVEVVTDDFFNSNPQRYSGCWKKVGDGKRPFSSKGDIYDENKDEIIRPSSTPIKKG